MANFRETDTSNLKAIVLCAGKGTRLRPLTSTLAKPLVPIANRPVLFYILDQISTIGIKEIGIVVSPENIHQIRSAVNKTGDWQASFHYIIQEHAGGLAHAVAISKEFLDKSPFLMFLGDNIIQGDLKQFTKKFIETNTEALILLKEVEDPRLFGVAEIGSRGDIVRLVEKPKEPKSNLAMVGVYYFTPAIHNAIEQIHPSSRGELEITDAIQRLLDQGEVVKSQVVTGCWIDTGKKDDVLEANRILLEELTRQDISGHADADSIITGKVQIGADTNIINSVVKGPVSIAGRCLIKNSVVNPFTSIGHGSSIESSLIENSIVMEEVRLSNVAEIKDSIIGSHSEIFGKRNSLQRMKIFIGGYDKLILS